MNNWSGLICKNIICFILTSCIIFLSGCGPEQDILANQSYGKGQHIKITKFYADWCPPCQEMKPEYEKMKTIYQYIEFDEVDVDRNKAAAAAHHVTGIPVVIKQKDGMEIERQPGYMSRNDLVRFIEHD
jgi:thioredoxin 1